MALHTWRRQHGPQIVAQVEPDEKGLDTWRASAWSTTDPRRIARSERYFNALVSARAMADHLARTAFHHTCDVETCGVWTIGVWTVWQPERRSLSSPLQERTARPWTCPACQTRIDHVGETPPNRVYRCHVCRLELVFDKETRRLILAPLPSDKQSPT
jgi:hypothetical protein